VKRAPRRRWRVGALAAAACAVCCLVELAVLGAFGTLTVGAVLAEATEFLPVLLAAGAAAAVVLAVRRQRRHRRPPPPVPLAMPQRRLDGEDNPVEQAPGRTRG
jgi:hypothetical protein